MFLFIGTIHVEALSPVAISPSAVATSPTIMTVSLSANSSALFSKEDLARSYFEYSETNQVCIAIYPTPLHCLPKKTIPGQMSVVLTDLKPATSYTIVFKRDNNIACITTPCPDSSFMSMPTVIVTPSNAYQFNRYLTIGSRGSDVTNLQDILRAKGYLGVASTGYFGTFTQKAVRLYQYNDMKITPTGSVGPKTRAALNTQFSQQPTSANEETFTGHITAVSTACFADGECSVTVDGNKVVTTIGWSQEIVGGIRGRVTDIGSLENNIGSVVAVYAKKTTDGYTLYGNSNYYIEVK